MPTRQKQGQLARIGLFMAIAQMFGAAAAIRKATKRRGDEGPGAARTGARDGAGSGGTGARVYDRKLGQSRTLKDRAGFKLLKRWYRHPRQPGTWYALPKKTRRAAHRRIRRQIARGYGYVAPPVKKVTTATA